MTAAKPPRKLILGVIAAVVAALPAGLAVAAGEQLTASTWANLNICSPTQLGARAQLAGDGTSKDMHVRFTAQWLSPTGWQALGGAATSPWQYAGSAEYTWGQAGWTYSLDVPASGDNYQLRAVAELQWRDGAGVTRSETRVTGGCTVTG
jgi:hypothetical protein